MLAKPESPNQNESMQQVLEIGARIKWAPSRRLVESAFHVELEAQLPLFTALSQVDLAHTLVMAENKVIPAQVAGELLKALKRLHSYPDDFCPDPALGDLYTNRESWLNAHLMTGGWLGAGRARREAITTAYNIKLREVILKLTAAMIALLQTLIDSSDQYTAALMPDYTYLQQAQPTSFGHYLLGFAYPLLRDLQRIRGCFFRINKSPAGCGSSNGSRLPQSRERLAELLGFQGVTTHARDAMWQADLQIELVAILSAVMINLDRLAEDLQIFASTEFGLIELHDSHARASKIMPQKKNPYALSYIRCLANSMIGTLTECTAMGRTPTGQPDNRLLLYGKVPAAVQDTENVVLLMNEVVTLLQFNTDHARSKLDHGFLQATDLAEMLVLECGISFRDAHRLVASLVHQYLPDGGFRQLTSATLFNCAETVLGYPVNVSASALEQALNPESSIASHRQTGGVAPEAISDMLRQCRQEMDEINIWCQQSQSYLQSADIKLDKCIEDFLASIEVR